MHKDDQQYMEAYDKLLECWLTLLENSSKFVEAASFQVRGAELVYPARRCRLSQVFQNIRKHIHNHADFNLSGGWFYIIKYVIVYDFQWMTYQRYMILYKCMSLWIYTCTTGYQNALWVVWDRVSYRNYFKTIWKCVMPFLYVVAWRGTYGGSWARYLLVDTK